MPLFSRAAAFLACIAGLVAAQGTNTPPSQDPFYVQPKNISSYTLGAIVRSRDITANVTTTNTKKAFQFMYRSNDSLANAVGDVMTFLVPTAGNSSRLLVYDYAYDSSNNDCSPSNSLLQGSQNPSTLDSIVISSLLASGYYITVSDYEGLKAEFTVGIQSGHAILDTIRASLTSTVRGLTGLSATAEYAIFGYSGGSIAAEWATEMAPTYSPKLNKFVGAAIGGIIPNITNVLLTVNNKFTSGLTFTGSFGISQAYSNFSNFINQELLPDKKANYTALTQSCGSSAGGMMDFFSYFKDGMAIIFSNVVQTVLSGSGQMGVHGIPQIPLYFYKGAHDEISPVADTNQLVDKYCDAGATIQYVVNPLTDHFAEALVGLPGALLYLADRFNGVAVQPGCTRQNISLSSVANETSVLTQDAINALRQALLDLPFNIDGTDKNSTSS